MAPEPEHDASICRPCRGTGELISGKGGTPTTVKCPWCDGTGTAQPGRDAQAAAAEQRAGS